LSGDHLDDVWHWLKPALDLAHGTHEQRDIFDGLVCGEFQLFKGSKSAALTEVIKYPRLRSVRVFIAGGDLEELVSIEEEITSWAREINAQRVEICGRRGWLRALTDYEESSTVMSKDIDHV